MIDIDIDICLVFVKYVSSVNVSKARFPLPEFINPGSGNRALVLSCVYDQFFLSQIVRSQREREKESEG